MGTAASSPHCFSIERLNQGGGGGGLIGNVFTKERTQEARGSYGKKNVGAEEATLSVKPHTSVGNGAWILSTHAKVRHSMVPVTLSTGDRDRRVPELAGQCSQSVSSGLQMRPHLKKEEDSRYYSLAYTHTQTHRHKHMHTHIQRI